MSKLFFECVVSGDMVKKKSGLLSRLSRDFLFTNLKDDDTVTISDNILKCNDNFEVLEALNDVLADPELDVKISLEDVVAVEKSVKTIHSLLYRMKLLVRKRGKLKE